MKNYEKTRKMTKNHTISPNQIDIESQKIMKNKRKITISNRSIDIETQKMHEKSVFSRLGASFVTPQRHALF